MTKLFNVIDSKNKVIVEVKKTKQTKDFYRFEFLKPQEPSPFIEAIFAYLVSSKVLSKKSGGFNTLGHSSAYKRATRLNYLYEYTDSFGLFEKGTLNDFFTFLISSKSHYIVYETKNLIMFIINNAEKFGLKWNAELNQALKEVPNIPRPKSIPRDGVGQKLMLSDYESESSTFEGMQYFWSDAWNKIQKIRDFTQRFYDFESQEFYLLYEFYSTPIKERKKLVKQGDCNFPIQFWSHQHNNTVFYSLLVSEDPLFIESLAVASKKQKAFKDCAAFEENVELFKTLANKKIKRLHSNLNGVPYYPHETFTSPFFSIKPTIEEERIIWTMLAKYSFTTSGLEGLKMEDVKFNYDTNTLQVSASKNRTGNQSKVRKDLVIFKRGQDGYTIISEYFVLMKRYYKFKSIEENKVEAMPFFLNSSFTFADWGFLTDCYKYSTAWQSSSRWSKIKQFIDQWSKVEEKNKLYFFLQNLKKNNPDRYKFELDSLGYESLNDIKKLSITPTVISQSGKISEFDYSIYSRSNIDDLPILDEFQDELSSSLRNHSLTVDVNTYFARNRSPIMLQAEHRVGKQVADMMVKEAKELSLVLSDNAEFISLSEIKDLFDLKTESEKIQDVAGFAEFINSSGFNLNEYFGVEKNNQIFILKHPLVLAIMKSFISHIDESLNILLSDQVPNTTEEVKLPEKISQVESIRVLVASMIERFDLDDHVQADMIIKKYDLPPFSPIF